jgi:hypothetical protein
MQSWHATRWAELREKNKNLCHMCSVLQGRAVGLLRHKPCSQPPSTGSGSKVIC